MVAAGCARRERIAGGVCVLVVAGSGARNNIAGRNIAGRNVAGIVVGTGIGTGIG
jgi:hypothetical protein